MRAEDPEGAGRGTGAIEWGSDAMAELLRRLDLRYIALVPGSSYRGLHDSLVNYEATVIRSCSPACTRSTRSRSRTATRR